MWAGHTGTIVFTMLILYWISQGNRKNTWEPPQESLKRAMHTRYCGTSIHREILMDILVMVLSSLCLFPINLRMFIGRIYRILWHKQSCYRDSRAYRGLYLCVSFLYRCAMECVRFLYTFFWRFDTRTIPPIHISTPKSSLALLPQGFQRFPMYSPA